MADTTSSITLPPPPAIGVAPGQHPYGNGTSNASHLPPLPLASLQTSDNSKSIPTSITSSGQVTSPTSPGSFIRRSAPEPNKRALYVGGLDPRVTEDVLRQIFETTGHVQNVKIIPDKNVSEFRLQRHLHGRIRYQICPRGPQQTFLLVNARLVTRDPCFTSAVCSVTLWFITLCHHH